MKREGGRQIKQAFCAGFAVGLAAQLRVPRKQRRGRGGKDPAGTTTRSARACGLSLSQERSRAAVSLTLLHASL